MSGLWGGPGEAELRAYPVWQNRDRRRVTQCKVLHLDTLTYATVCTMPK